MSHKILEGKKGIIFGALDNQLHGKLQRLSKRPVVNLC